MGETLRLVTWNIMGPPGELDSSRLSRLAGIAKILRDEAPDVVCLQEAWDGAADDLANTLGMRVAARAVVGPSESDGCPASDVLENSVLSRWPVLDSFVADLPHDEYGPRPAVAAVVSGPGQRPWTVLSVHLSWGAANEGLRLQQARAIEAIGAHAAIDPDAVVVIGGDFNALPDSATLRYLHGLDPDADGGSTQWVDAWDTAGDGPGITSDPLNIHADATARNVGITRPDLLPARRIDFVLVRGYAYGRPGCPLEAHLVGDDATASTPSDHYGISTLLWAPAPRIEQEQ
jgi:endonuclease/exonuclease/phosphatase family metal-dependent hydrolase